MTTSTNVAGGKHGPDKGPDTIPIHIEGEQFKVPAGSLTGAQLRAVPEPDIAADRKLWLEQPGNQDDTLVRDGDSIELKPGMHFYTSPGTINPGGA